MHWRSVLTGSAVFSATALASIFSSSPDLEVIGSFPDDNPLSLVYNGQSNTINLKLRNHAKTDISLEGISGAFREVGGKERHLANTTASKYSLVIPAGSPPVDVPYRFWSEIKPQDLGFTVYVDYADASAIPKEIHRTVGYDGTVTVREPQGSWFDLQLLLLYPLVLALLGLPLYWLYTAFVAPKLFPKKKTKRVTRSTAVVASSPTPRPGTPSDPNEWIPEHHLRTRRTVSGRNLVAKGTGGVTPQGGATSGDETSGNESTSPRRSARANKGKRA